MRQNTIVLLIALALGAACSTPTPQAPTPLPQLPTAAPPTPAPATEVAPVSDAPPPTATAAPAPSPAATSTIEAPLALISRGLPAFATPESQGASLANDADYSTVWRSQGVPASLTYDLGSLSPAQRARVLLVWYNGTYGYTHTMGCLGVGYNNLGAYLIEAHRADAPPSEDGWVTLVEVHDNTFHSRQHLLELAGYSWLRLRALASDGSPQNEDVAINMDLYDAGAGVSDGWIFLGDSITAGAMGHGTSDAVETGANSFADQVFAGSGGRAFPPQEDGGVPCITTADLAPLFDEWLARFPGRYVAVSLGTNDALAVSPESFYANYAAMADATLAAGKVLVVPTIPWSPDPERQAHILDLNAQLGRLYAVYPEVMRGPDLWTFFAEHPQLISDDQIHPTPSGYATYRTVWASFAIEKVYGAGRQAPAP